MFVKTMPDVQWIDKIMQEIAVVSNDQSARTKQINNITYRYLSGGPHN
ncbi:hypothetical protein DSUL_50191 [Desulfovibrionales bacterium]